MVACGIWDAEVQFESDIFYFAQFSNVGSSPAAPILLAFNDNWKSSGLQNHDTKVRFLTGELWL